jgi:vitamin-K-epoxide reductase (warfarin-sensitive)
MKNRIGRLVILLLCICGIALSIASLRSHYASSSTDYCDLNAMFNCDLVNRSKFSELLGIPVALFGLLGYLALLGLTFKKIRRLELLRFLASLLGLIFALYLAYIEEFVLHTWCLLCIGSLAAITGITIASATELRLKTQQSS